MVMESLVLEKPAPGIELAVGLRTYLEIVKVEAPSEASYGDTVSINIYVKNKWTARIFAIVTGAYDTAEVTSTSHYIDAGAQRVFGLSFTMPNKSVTLWVWAWYWTDAGWSTSPDDEYGPVKIALARWVLLASKTLTISPTLPPVVGWTLLASKTLTVKVSAVPPPVGWSLLASKTLTVKPVAPPPVGWTLLASKTVTVKPTALKGTIVKKELEYDGKQAPIPVADVPVTLHGLVHIWGRNDMATNQKLGLSWVIKDPDGLVMEQGTDWEGVEILPEWLPGGYTGPGGQHHFIIPPGALKYVEFEKLGTYTMSIQLLMNPTDPVVVATYDGALCTVTIEVPPEYELIQHTIYPHAYIYEGEAEIGVATFDLPVGPPPIVDWLGAKIINSFADKVEEQGSRMLELKVHRYTSVPWVHYRLEATAAVTPQEGIGIAVWPVLAALPWKAIITAAIIAAIMIIVTNLVILPVLRIFFERKPGLSEEVKKQWSREYIIGIIIDMRPAYSPEELGAMSDQELRDVLNEVYAEEVPPAGLKWWQWCIIGGVGIAGGALAYRFISPLLPKKKKEEKAEK